MSHHTLGALLRETETPPESEDSQGRERFFNSVLSRVREVNNELSRREELWANRLWSSKARGIESAIRDFGLTEWSAEDREFKGKSDISAPVSPAQICKRVLRALGLEVTGLSTNDSTMPVWSACTFATGLHSSPTSRVWLPVFYHPRGNVFETHDPSDVHWTTALTQIETEFDALRPDRKDDLVRVEYHEWVIETRFTVSVQLFQEIAGKRKYVFGNTVIAPPYEGILPTRLENSVLVRETGRVRDSL